MIYVVTGPDGAVQFDYNPETGVYAVLRLLSVVETNPTVTKPASEDDCL